MTVGTTDHERAGRSYARLVALYPKAHRDEFGAQMLRTFEDNYRDATRDERRVGLGFWLAVLWDEGRSILRERAVQPEGDVLFMGLVLIWVCAIPVVVTRSAARDWHNLAVPAAGLAVLFLAVPGTVGVVRRLATATAILGVIEFIAGVVPKSLQNLNDFVAPVLLVACMAFSIKTLAGLNAWIAGAKDGVWVPEELKYGLVAGAIGVVGVASSVLDTSDNSPAFAVLFYIVVPFVCAVAGFKASRRSRSMRTGVYAALGSVVAAAFSWVVALPLVVEWALQGYLRGESAGSILPIYWQGPLSVILFWSALNGVIGAFFGAESLRTDTSAAQPTSPTQ